MELEGRVDRMDEEFKLLKNEIRQVLLEVQEHVLNAESPFTNVAVRPSSAQEPGIQIQASGVQAGAAGDEELKQLKEEAMSARREAQAELKRVGELATQTRDAAAGGDDGARVQELQQQLLASQRQAAAAASQPQQQIIAPQPQQQMIPPQPQQQMAPPPQPYYPGPGWGQMGAGPPDPAPRPSETRDTDTRERPSSEEAAAPQDRKRSTEEPETSQAERVTRRPVDRRVETNEGGDPEDQVVREVFRETGPVFEEEDDSPPSVTEGSRGTPLVQDGGVLPAPSADRRQAPSLGPYEEVERRRERPANNGVQERPQGPLQRVEPVQEEGSEVLDLVTLAGLAQWVERGLRKAGKEYIETLLEVSEITGRLTSERKRIILTFVRLLGDRESADGITATEMVSLLAQLDCLLGVGTSADTRLLPFLLQDDDGLQDVSEVFPSTQR